VRHLSRGTNTVLHLMPIATVLLSTSIGSAQQQTLSVEMFANLRTIALRSTSSEIRLNPKLLVVFAIGSLPVVTGATAKLPIDGGTRELTIAFAVTADDMFLADFRTKGTGAAIHSFALSVFHSDVVSVRLRAAASGDSYESLQLTASDALNSEFEEVLLVWKQLLPGMLQKMR